MREDLFWQKVSKAPHPKGCWEWAASRDESGYGRFGIGGCRWDRAHRVSWKFHFGAITKGKFVLHTCDNPKCVRPDHLYLGSKKNNAQDRETRGRGNHATGVRHGRYTHPGQTAGARNGRAKLDEQQVSELLKKHFKQGRQKADLAREYNLSKTTVGYIVSGKLWPNVEGRV